MGCSCWGFDWWFSQSGTFPVQAEGTPTDAREYLDS